MQPILADMFELEVNSVHALVSKMIINEELMASLDQPSQCIVMHRSVISVMHQLMIINDELMASCGLAQPVHRHAQVSN